MKIRKYLELQKTFRDRTFEGKYGLLDKLLFMSSYLGNIASIFFAFWFISRLLYRATTDFTGRDIVVVAVSLLFLSTFELIKRFVLKNFSLSVIQNKKINAEVIYNVIFSLILLSGSFYSSLSGAKIFADKREIVEQQITIDISTRIDSINVLYDKKIQYKITERDNLRESRDIYNEKIKTAEYTSRLKQYTEMLTQANTEIQRADKELEILKDDKNKDIQSIKSELKISSDKQVNQISRNQIAFLIISSFIELLILVGIWFHSLFRLKVYQEYRQDMENNMNYETYRDYLKMLIILLRNGKVELQSELQAQNVFIALVRKREEFPHAYIKDFLDICKELGIIAVTGKKKTVVVKKFEDAKIDLLDYFEED